jgi:hypothetical protein
MSTSRNQTVLSLETRQSISDVADRVQKGRAPGPELQKIIAALNLAPAKACEEIERSVRQSFAGWASCEAVVGARLPMFWRTAASAEDALQRWPELAYLYLFHGSGYLRESALTRWAWPPSSPLMLAAIAIRMNDWVQQVRVAAKRCAELWFPSVAPEVVVDAFDFLIQRHDILGRWDVAERLVVEDMLYRRDVLVSLAHRLQHQKSGPARRTLLLALRRPGFDFSLPELASAVMPSVRAVAIQTLIERRATWQNGFTLEWIDKRYGKARKVPTMSVRDIALDLKVDDLLLTHSEDRSPLVRKVVANALIDRIDVPTPIYFEIASRLTRDRSSVVASKAEYFLQNARRDVPVN